jgi:hypothetical protein
MNERLSLISSLPRYSFYFIAVALLFLHFKASAVA